MTKGWIGVDFDGTLSVYDTWQGIGVYGPPVPLMVERIKKWLAAGITVKIMTARAVDSREVAAIEDWLTHVAGLPALMVTDRKDYSMIELWDDRAVQVRRNTGQRMDGGE